MEKILTIWAITVFIFGEFVSYKEANFTCNLLWIAWFISTIALIYK